ncbi:hybrid sensor histidine kinase/response regulator [Paucibacter soli]|uniref:hybrid sensor histidine kinase/response regulator n=1 Tax=Paucibacter soli TaxID=3133433 RepID=UPI0030973B98
MQAMTAPNAAARLHSLTIISTAILGVLKQMAGGMNAFADAPKSNAISMKLEKLAKAAAFTGLWGVGNFLSALRELSAGIEAIPPSTVNRNEHLERVKTLSDGIAALGGYLRDLSYGNVVSYSALNEQFGRVVRKARPQLLEVSPSEIEPFLFMPAPPSLEVEAFWEPEQGASNDALRLAIADILNAKAMTPGLAASLASVNPYRTLSGLFDAMACEAGFVGAMKTGSDVIHELERIDSLLVDGLPSQLPAPDGFLFSRVLFAVAQSDASDEATAKVRRRYSLMKPGATDVSMHDVAKKFSEGMRRFQESFTQATITRTPVVVAKLAKSVAGDSHRLDSEPFTKFAMLMMEVTQGWTTGEVRQSDWVLGSAVLLLMTESAKTWGNADAQSQLSAQADQMVEDGQIHVCPSLQASVRAAAVQKTSEVIAASFKKLNLSIESALRAVGNEDIPESNAARIADVAGAPLTKYLNTISGVVMCWNLPRAGAFAAAVAVQASSPESWGTRAARSMLFDNLTRVNLFMARLRPGSLLDIEPDEERDLRVETSAQVIQLFTREEVHARKPEPEESGDDVVDEAILATGPVEAEVPNDVQAPGEVVVDEVAASAEDTHHNQLALEQEVSPVITDPAFQPSFDIATLVADDLDTGLSSDSPTIDPFDIGEEAFGFDAIPVVVADLPAPEELLNEFIGAQEGRLNSLDGADDELLAIMFDESWECMDGIEKAFAGVRALDDSEEHVADARRLIHTLKGVCRTCGLDAAGAILHAMEDRLDAMPNDSGVMEPVLSAFEGAMEAVREQLDQERARHQAVGVGSAEVIPDAEVSFVVDPHPVEELAETVVEVEIKHVEESPHSAVVDQVVAQPESKSLSISEPAPATQRPTQGARLGQQSGTVRIPISLADKVGRTSSQVMAGSRQAIEELDAIARSVRELEENLRRLGPDLRQLEIMAASSIASASSGGATSGFDPLELDRYTELQEVARRLTEAYGDAMSSAGLVAEDLRRASTSEADRALISDELQRGSSELLLAPVLTQQSRLERVVAKACADTGKTANLSVDSAARVPTAAMDKLMPVFEHLLRNSVAHGIESRDTREASGKQVAGMLTISVPVSETSEGGVVRISIRDDGAGIDLARVQEFAERRGLVAPGAKLSDDAIRELLFASGFSTADHVSELSGRGVGLDVVRATVSSLGGVVTVSSTPGQGTEFILALPTDSDTMAVIPVTSAGFKCLLPLTLVRRIVPISAGAEVQVDLSSRKATVGGVEYELVDLSKRVPSGRTAARSGRGVLVLMKVSNVVKAVLVDAVANQTRVPVKPLGPFVRDIPGMIAGTTLPNGAVGLIVNPLALDELNSTNQEAKFSQSTRRVMVVDDSSTVRLVTTRFLKRCGYSAEAARDGIEALQMLAKGSRPDVFLFDLEMPGMGGFELIAEVRRIERFASTPIVVITSRTAEKHRERAIELGASAYLAKPYEETQLLDVISGLVAAEAH